jgi:hypothetical protein
MWTVSAAPRAAWPSPVRARLRRRSRLVAFVRWPWLPLVWGGGALVASQEALDCVGLPFIEGKDDGQLYCEDDYYRKFKCV